MCVERHNEGQLLTAITIPWSIPAVLSHIGSPTTYHSGFVALGESNTSVGIYIKLRDWKVAF